jgi:hypothetical protein
MAKLLTLKDALTFDHSKDSVLEACGVPASRNDSMKRVVREARESSSTHSEFIQNIVESGLEVAEILLALYFA